jgi:hypothetical protein
MKKAYEDCRHTISLTEDLPNFKNKDEALEFFCKKSGQNLKSSEKYRELIVKRLLKQ